MKKPTTVKATQTIIKKVGEMVAGGNLGEAVDDVATQLRKTAGVLGDKTGNTAEKV